MITASEPSIPPVPAAIVWPPTTLLSTTPSSSPNRSSPQPPRRKIQVSSVLSVLLVSASNSIVAPYSRPVSSFLPRAMTWTSVSLRKSRLRDCELVELQVVLLATEPLGTQEAR